MRVISLSADHEIGSQKLQINLLRVPHKNQCRGGIAKKGVLRQFCQFKEGAWQEPGVVVFLRGVDTPKHTMSHFDIF